MSEISAGPSMLGICICECVTSNDIGSPLTTGTGGWQEKSNMKYPYGSISDENCPVLGRWFVMKSLFSADTNRTFSFTFFSEFIPKSMNICE